MDGETMSVPLAVPNNATNKMCALLRVQHLISASRVIVAAGVRRVLGIFTTANVLIAAR